MKKWKKVFLALLCMAVMLGVTACGTRNNGVDDNAGTGTTTDQLDTNNNATDNANNVNDGVINDTGNAIKDGVNDVGNAVGEGVNAIGNGIENVTDDLTGENTNNNNNKTTNP